MTIMNIKHIFSFAVLAVMTAACSSEDIIQQPTFQSGQTLPFRATISTYSGTRGLTEASDHKSITAKWEVTEKIALVHSRLDNDNNPIVDVMEVKYVEPNTGNAYIEGAIANYSEDETVYLVYTGHNEMSMNDYPGVMKNILDAAKQYAQDNSQPEPTAITREMIIGSFSIPREGTLADINDCSDYRLGTSTLIKKNFNGTDYVTFGSDVPTLSSQFAMWKLTLTTDGTNPLLASQLYITCGGKTYTIDPTGDTTLSTFYVLLPASTNATYKFKATDGTNTYIVTYSGVTLAAAKFYCSTLTLKPATGTNDYNIVTTVQEW